MKYLFPIWLAVLVLIAVGSVTCAEGLGPIATKLLAAMPIMEQGMTQLAISTGTTESQVVVSRAIAPYALVRGSASTSGSLGLCVRLLAPLELAPAFDCEPGRSWHIQGHGDAHSRRYSRRRLVAQLTRDGHRVGA